MQLKIISILVVEHQEENTLTWLDELMQERGCANGLAADVVSTHWEN